MFCLIFYDDRQSKNIKLYANAQIFFRKKTIFCEAMSGVVFCLTFLAISHGEIIK